MLNHELKAIENRAFQWKMSFDPDPTKQAEQVIFSSKSKLHIPQFISKATVPRRGYTGLILEKSLTFTEYVKEAVIKARRAIDIRFMARYMHRDVLDQNVQALLISQFKKALVHAAYKTKKRDISLQLLT